MTIIDFLSTNLIELLYYLTDTSKRIYWGYLASSILLAVWVYWRTVKLSKNDSKQQDNKQAAKPSLLAFIFPKKIYTAKSARLDYALLVVNKLLKAALFPLVILTLAPIAIGVANGLESLFGTIAFLEWSALSIMVTFTVFLFLADDFSRFLLHYLMHRIGWLWEFHKVHHSAKVLTPFTIYRTHPIESYLYACRMALSQGVVVGCCYYLFGPQLKMIDILGANTFVFLFNIAGANLRHSHIWLSWGDKVENWFISPAQHQVHHSNIPRLHHKNFGSALAIWDRMFKCHIQASKVKELTIGLEDPRIDHSSLVKMYFQPFQRVFYRLRNRA